ncbi:Flagellar biosynthetic protein FliP precursor [Pseudovibrio axinellae]|uniref:Flagellar biosynthetic protein FliP n=2 Tax=Pseudovibrio axinellae TaxID=989403 RepID=A0A165TY35_9HYPH|nr:flagellar type III secretion system pore protein FliP [Pseudovibrio axinellae]KZL08450.1 Flagellar biosynthetic protein FliP precursor [Pseudovibrio axinellae]SEP74211.1 flagellar biosynthetic protein FliP [Pseudovibrio axinellae]
MRCLAFFTGFLSVFAFFWVMPAQAQELNLGDLLPAGEASASGRIIQYVMILTVLSLAPGILIMVTSFTRFVVALSFLRSGIGLQTTPANIILISLALFMTFYVMAPTFDAAWKNGLQPLIKEEISENAAYTEITKPFRQFMLDNVREKDLVLFDDLAVSSFNYEQNAPLEELDLRVLIPAFMISELRRGFEIGFLIALPFVVIDMIVATLTMSMGMMMLPPTVISLPFKVLFFVLIDGWYLLTGGLIRSFT